MNQSLMRLVLLVWTTLVVQQVRAEDLPLSLEPLSREQMRQEMDRLEAICIRLGLNGEAEISRGWLREQRSDQQRYYLPIGFPPESQNSDAERWRGHFIKARKRHALFLYDQATQAADSGDEAIAYRLLWQTLREDPEHPQAQKILGPLLSSVTARPQRRAVANASDFSTLGPVQRWQSPHFDVTSRAPAAAAQKLLTKLEQYFVIWTQCFYEVWAPPGILRARLSKERSASWPDRGRLEVVYLANRAEYLKLLGMAESKIAVSVGYYHPQLKRSFFYDHQDNHETVVHELTHQMFAEASVFATSKSDPLQFDRMPGAWCMEGIALYMESLRLSEEGWTLGGIDSPRLQTARYRALRDSYWPAWEVYAKESIADWKENPRIALSYSHAAGLTHTFFDLHQDHSAARQAYLQYLTGVYSGQESSQHLMEMLGLSEDNAKENYQRLMTIDDAQLESLTRNTQWITQLVLCRSRLNSWHHLRQFKRLEWLDLSFSNIDNDQLDWLTELKELRRLSVEGTQVTGSILSFVSKLTKLEELDLSQCQIDDTQLSTIEGHPSLEVLWLSQTQVSDQALKSIQSLPKLRQCEVSGTRVSPTAWEDFVSKHERLGK